MRRCASIAIAVQARACMGLRARTAVRPLLPAPGAQPALNPCLCSPTCKTDQNLKQLKPALPAPCQDPPEEERASRLCAHSPACHLCHYHQHNMTISCTRQWSLSMSACQGQSASGKNGSQKRLIGPARDTAMTHLTTDLNSHFTRCYYQSLSSVRVRTQIRGWPIPACG